jgi:hypothetical protein
MCGQSPARSCEQENASQVTGGGENDASLEHRFNNNLSNNPASSTTWADDESSMERECDKYSLPAKRTYQNKTKSKHSMAIEDTSSKLTTSVVLYHHATTAATTTNRASGSNTADIYIINTAEDTSSKLTTSVVLYHHTTTAATTTNRVTGSNTADDVDTSSTDYSFFNYDDCTNTVVINAVVVNNMGTVAGTIATDTAATNPTSSDAAAVITTTDMNVVDAFAAVGVDVVTTITINMSVAVDESILSAETSANAAQSTPVWRHVTSVMMYCCAAAATQQSTAALSGQLHSNVEQHAPIINGVDTPIWRHATFIPLHCYAATTASSMTHSEDMLQFTPPRWTVGRNRAVLLSAASITDGCADIRIYPQQTVGATDACVYPQQVLGAAASTMQSVSTTYGCSDACVYPQHVLGAALFILQSVAITDGCIDTCVHPQQALGADSSWQFLDAISAHDLYIMGTLSILSLAKNLFLSETKTGGALALLAL